MSATFSGRKSQNKKSAGWLRVFGAAILVTLACAPLLFSQTSQGTIEGSVFDQTGGAIAGAMVTVVDVARGVTRSLTSDAAGQYVAVSLNPGTYTVRAEAKGFRTVEHSGVLVEVGQNIRVDLVLQPGEQTQTITVTSEIPAIDTTDAVLGGAVSNEAINELPLNGRNFERLLQLRPGLNQSVGTGAGATSTNGRRVGSDLVLVEGIATLGQTSDASVLNTVYHGGDASSLVPIDAIQEFNTAQDPKAEYGWKDGSVVNVGVKSGTNSLHGTAYAFGRDASATDAANYFSTPGVPAVTPANLEQFGATAGGRILKDKLFWFASYEGLRIQTGDVAVDSIPSDIAGPGAALSLVDACNALRTAGKTISPLSAQISGLNPATCIVSPASSSFENLWPFQNSVSTLFSPALTSTGPLNNGLFKADYIPGPHHHFSGMYYVSKANQLQNNLPGELTNQWEDTAILDTPMIEGAWTWTPNSTWVNDVRFGLVYLNNEVLPNDQGIIPSNPFPSGYSFPTGVTNPLYGGMTEVQLTGFTGFLGAGNRSSRRGPQGDADLTENVSHLRGKHAFKFGFEFLDVLDDGDQFSQAQGDIKFKSGQGNTVLENYLLGIPSSGTILLGDPTEVIRSRWFGGYAQDDWRLSPRLTLNIGLRYDYQRPPIERDNYLGNFNPNVPAGTPAIEQAGPGAPLHEMYNPDPYDFAPRLGVAWDVRGNGKTVVRAGGSIITNATLMGELLTIIPFGANFPDLGVNNSGTAANLHTPVAPALTGCKASSCGPGGLSWTTAGPIFPTTNPVTLNGVSYTGPTCTAAAPCTTGAVDQNYRQARAAEWNLDVQRALTNSLTLGVAYIGNHGFDEEISKDLNQPPLGTGYNAPFTAAEASAAGLPASDVGLSSNQVCLNGGACGVVNSGAEVAAQPYHTLFPYLSYIAATSNGAFSNYDALQVTVNERTSHGLSFLAGYTYSHSLDTLNSDDSGGAFVPTDSYNLRADYANGDQDLRHRFTFSPTYLIPGIKSPGQMLQGWEVSGILTLQSGLPWTANDQSDDLLGTNDVNFASSGPSGTIQPWNYSGPTSAFESGPQSINQLTGAAATTACSNAAVAAYPGNTQLQQLALAALNQLGCYAQNGGFLTPPTYGMIGNAGRNSFRTPGYYNVDMSVAKTWKFKERFSAQFRAEFFNLFNRADFSIVPAQNDPSGGGTFGCSCSTPDVSNPVLGSGGPRHIQFGLKLIF